MTSPYFEGTRVQAADTFASWPRRTAVPGMALIAATYRLKPFSSAGCANARWSSSVNRSAIAIPNDANAVASFTRALLGLPNHTCEGRSGKPGEALDTLDELLAHLLTLDFSEQWATHFLDLQDVLEHCPNGSLSAASLTFTSEML